MRIFLTGAAGFVGAATLRLALEDGHDVLAAVRPGEPARRLLPFSGRYTRLDIDISDTAQLSADVIEWQPETVIHCAWTGVTNTARFSHEQIFDNIDTACALIDACAKAGASAFVALGSQGEYGAGTPMYEDQLPSPTTLYGAAKVASLFLTRQLAAQAGMRHVWLRLFSTYGPDDNDGWLIPTMITEMLAGRRPRTTLGTQTWDWLHVDDVARALLAAAIRPTAGVFNLGSGQSIEVRRIVEMIRDQAAPDLELVFGEIDFRPDQVMFMQADITRLCAATDWAPRIAIEEGIADTVAWYRAQATGMNWRS